MSINLSKPILRWQIANANSGKLKFHPRPAKKNKKGRRNSPLCRPRRWTARSRWPWRWCRTSPWRGRSRWCASSSRTGLSAGPACSRRSAGSSSRRRCCPRWPCRPGSRPCGRGCSACPPRSGDNPSARWRGRWRRPRPRSRRQHRRPCCCAS